MNLFKLSWSNILAKPLSAFLSLLLMAMAVAIISLLFLVNRQFEDQFTNNVKGIDIVLGAKGSPLQLILSSVYHVDAPTGNISLKAAQKVVKNPLVAKAIPLSYGDAYKSYRIVGTTHDFPEKYQMELKEGQLWSTTYEVNVGSSVAKKLNLKVGDGFYSAHGLLDETHIHEEQQFKVVGIFKPSNSVGDQLILTAQESVWAIHGQHSEETEDSAHAPHDHDGHNHDGHDHHEHDGHDHAKAPEKPKEITAMLVKFRSPLGLVQLPRMINQQTSMQAALPSIEVNRLFDQLGIGIFTMQLIALGIMLVSGISVFVSLFNSLRERRYEMALMRSMGASRGQLFVMVLLEGLFLVICGFILGTLMSRLGIFLLNNYTDKNFHYNLSAFQWVKEEWWLLGISLLIGLLAALIPAIQAARTNISATLSEG